MHASAGTTAVQQGAAETPATLKTHRTRSYFSKYFSIVGLWMAELVVGEERESRGTVIRCYGPVLCPPLIPLPAKRA